MIGEHATKTEKKSKNFNQDFSRSSEFSNIVLSINDNNKEMNNVTFQKRNLKMSDHAVERVSQRFGDLDLNAVFSRAKKLDHQNCMKFGQAMATKYRNMQSNYPGCSLVVNEYFNAAFAVNLNTETVITAMYADGTWSDL